MTAGGPWLSRRRLASRLLGLGCSSSGRWRAQAAAGCSRLGWPAVAARRVGQAGAAFRRLAAWLASAAALRGARARPLGGPVGLGAGGWRRRGRRLRGGLQLLDGAGGVLGQGNYVEPVPGLQQGHVARAFQHLTRLPAPGAACAGWQGGGGGWGGRPGQVWRSGCDVQDSLGAGVHGTPRSSAPPQQSGW